MHEELTRTTPRRADTAGRIARRIHAIVRDTRVLLYEFRVALTLAAIVVFGGATALMLFYDAGPKPDFVEAIFDMLQLLAFQAPMKFPGNWGLRLLFVLAPIFSAVVLAESLVRFGVLFFNRKNRMEAWNVALAATVKNHVVVAGLGRVGLRICEELTAMGESFVAIEQSREASFVDTARTKGFTVLTGDARSRDQLLEANLEHAKAVICATNDDLANVEIALTAREIKPAIRAIVRMFDPALARKLANAFDVETFSTTAISAPVFAAAATDRNILHSFHLGELLLSIAQLQIGDKSKLSGVSIREIEAKYDASIVVLFRKAKPDFHPAGDIVIGNGDRIAVLASMETLNDIEKDNGITA